MRLVCPVKGFPTPQVTWLMNDQKVETTERFLIDWRTNSLVIDGVNIQDTGQVSCVAENSVGRAEQSSFVSILSEFQTMYQVKVLSSCIGHAKQLKP